MGICEREGTVTDERIERAQTYINLYNKPLARSARLGRSLSLFILSMLLLMNILRSAFPAFPITLIMQ
jgi:hypothetical protein